MYNFICNQRDANFKIMTEFGVTCLFLRKDKIQYWESVRKQALYQFASGNLN